jgi:hypothetical protein
MMMEGGGGVAWRGGGGSQRERARGGGGGVVWGRADGPIMKYGFPICGSAAFQHGLLSLVELFQQDMPLSSSTRRKEG